MSLSSATSLTAARERLLPQIEHALQAVFADRTPRPRTPDDRLPAHDDAVSPGPIEAMSGRSEAEATRTASALARAPLPSSAPVHYGMMRYHLGWVDEQLRPTNAPAGKRLRPLLCLLAAEACGSPAGRAMPAAVAIELLHNFTLIHDDIEDGDALRHHRPTLWRLWGEPLAINAGDGMHVLSLLAMLDLRTQGVPEATVLEVVAHLGEVSLTITEGQHLDLAFERRADVTPAEYLDMIARKSAALLRGAALIGAGVAGAPAAAAVALATFGFELGMGFQIRDDILGIWGRSETTGKPAGDLRRRKKTLPTLYTLSRAGEADDRFLRTLFATPDPPEEAVAAALDTLERYGAREHCEQMVASYSVAARRHLDTLEQSEAKEALEALVGQLERRER